MGSKCSYNAVLLVNFPQKQIGQTKYTMTQHVRVSQQMVGEQALEEDSQERGEAFKGSELDTHYLERVEPITRDGAHLEFSLRFEHTGSFFIQIEYVDWKTKQKQYTKPQFINVEPVMNVTNQEVRVKQLSILTVLSRCLGQIDKWDGVLENVSQLGYNAIHYVPIQQYGASGSHYSLKDQTNIDDFYFGLNAPNLSREQRLEYLQQKVSQIKNQYGLLGIVDIVLNHTANNTEWIIDHPDATYNTENCPHLHSAWLLDDAIAQLALRYSRREVRQCPSAPYINNENDLNKLIDVIRNETIPSLKLHEFFLFNVDESLRKMRDILRNQQKGANLEKIRKKLEKLNAFQKDSYALIKEELCEGQGGPNRFGVSLSEEAVYLIYHKNNQNEERSIQEARGLMQRMNDDWVNQIKGYMNEACNSIHGTIRYYVLEKKKNHIAHDNDFMPRYFTVLNNHQKSKVAHNGWIMNHDPTKDFVLTGWHYLRRNINIWGDCIKLRYGQCPADSPYLWKHMSTYVSDMARIFDGFRLDNAHSTPIHVCQYLLNVARNQNDKLFVMAELFTNSAEIDADFVQKLNINGLIRELQNSWDARKLGDYFHYLTCREAVLGLVDTTYEDLEGNLYKILQPQKPNEIIYDITHDNPTNLKKFNSARLSLPVMGLNSMADQAIASTWGVDQLIPEQLNVVSERRLYETFDQTAILNGQQSQKDILMEAQNAFQVQSPNVQKQRFEIKDNRAQKVYLAGSFTDWKPSIEMQKQDHETFIYEIEFPIIEGESTRFEYKYVINGNDWRINNQQPHSDDGKGNTNNYFTVNSKSSHQPMPSFSPKHNIKKNFQDIRYARRLLNEVHDICNKNNAEIFLHQQSDDIIVLIRQFELDFGQFDAYVAISRFSYNDHADYKCHQVIELPGKLVDVVFAGYLEVPNNSYSEFYGNKDRVKGAKANFQVFNDLSKFCEVRQKQEESYKDQLFFHTMPPSFVCILKTTHSFKMKEIVKNFNELKHEKTKYLSQQVDGISLAGLNHLLFRCDTEERDISQQKRGTYGLQNYGQFKYAGISSFMHIIREIKENKDMGHELFNNMREGDWYLEYAKDRLTYMGDELRPFIDILNKVLTMIKQLPKTYRPKYGARVIEKLYDTAIYQLMREKATAVFITDTNDPFLQALAKGILQVYGKVPSAFFGQFQDTLAAGLPHFSTGYTRCWGRDTFIALRGLFLCTELYEDARNIILYFAGTMRHGLIPNLHDQGNNTRFNARDATWFFLQAIKDYVLMSRESYDFLKQEVRLIFSNNELVTIEELIQRILQAHAEGIEFREWNAGTKIDAHMKDQGFNIRIYLDENTGFIHGGNEFNCGTWMDKMGSGYSNRGIPATPRDGAPIELTALLYSTVTFLHESNQVSSFKYSSVKKRSGQSFTYQEWADLIYKNFEKHYFIPIDPREDKDYMINSKMVNRRGIYKDVLGSTHQYTDYQLRCNLCVAMSYADSLFNRKNAQECLKRVEDILMEEGCMGIKTLDPSDKNYRGDYDNNDESQGWNYHQGPEWVWPVGFFLKSKLLFNDYKEKTDAQMDIMRWLVPHMKHIQKDQWESIPELTNSHGKHCPHSCTAQAWSISTLIDALSDLQRYDI